MRNRFFGYLLCILFIDGCTSLPSKPPAVSSTTITLTSLGNAGGVCNKTTTGTEHIDFVLDVVVWYYDSRSGRTRLSSQTVSSNHASINKFPLSFNINTPNTGADYPYEIEFNVVGENCTTCGNGFYGDQNDPSNNCFAQTFANPANGQYLYSKGAKPRWSDVGSYIKYEATMSINYLSRIRNVPNSCGCQVQ